MSPLVKTKRQANFKDFKRFGAFKGFVEQKNVVFNSFVCQLGFFGTRQINYSIAVITFYLLRPLKLTNQNQSQIQSVQLFITFAT
jgi:hypothetical protein